MSKDKGTEFVELAGASGVLVQRSSPKAQADADYLARVEDDLLTAMAGYAA